MSMTNKNKLNMNLTNLPTLIKHMLTLQAEISEMSERMVWLSKMDLKTFNPGKAEEIRDIYYLKSEELAELKRRYL